MMGCTGWVLQRSVRSCLFKESISKTYASKIKRKSPLTLQLGHKLRDATSASADMIQSGLV